MPEFFHLLDAQKSVKYILASPVNQTRVRKGRVTRSGDAIHQEIFVVRINHLPALTSQQGASC
jgi:hypothetical protein